MKICPFCGAEVHEMAVMCVHCKAMLNAAPTMPNVSDANICPNCGNECIKEAIICVRCGQSLEKNKTPVNNQPVAKKKRDGIDKTVGVGAICFAIIGIISGISSLFSVFSYGYELTIITTLISFIGSICVCMGFIIRKNNVLPGIGYIITMLSSVLGFVLGRIVFARTMTLISLVIITIAIVQNVLMATLYFNKKPDGRKLWFVPVILAAVIMIINVIANFADGYYYSGYYYTLFVWQIFVKDILMRIGTVVGILLACANAKLNWHKPATVSIPPVQTPVV